MNNGNCNDSNNNYDSNDDNDSDDSSEEYVVQTKVCKRLSIELKDTMTLEEVEIDPNIIVHPPEKYGLENTPLIIPNYYNLYKSEST